jgi:hypothetical protein
MAVMLSIMTRPCCFASTPPEVCEGRVAPPRKVGLGWLKMSVLASSEVQLVRHKVTNIRSHMISCRLHYHTSHIVPLFCHVSRITCPTALSRSMRLVCGFTAYTPLLLYSCPPVAPICCAATRCSRPFTATSGIPLLEGVRRDCRCLYLLATLPATQAYLHNPTVCFNQKMSAP